MMNISCSRFDNNYNYVNGYNTWKIHSSKLDATKETIAITSALFIIYHKEILLPEFILLIKLLTQNYGQSINNEQLKQHFSDNTISAIENLQNSLLFHSLSKSLEDLTTNRHFTWFRNKLSLLPETAQNLYNHIEECLTEYNTNFSYLFNHDNAIPKDILAIAEAKNKLLHALEQMRSEHTDYKIVQELCNNLTTAEEDYYNSQKYFIKKYHLQGL